MTPTQGRYGKSSVSVMQGQLWRCERMAALTGMAFVVLGSSYWGRCYAFGASFYALALLMHLDLRWSPIEFGITWFAVLIMISLALTPSTFCLNDC